jgi:hypothetical protein
MEGANSFWKQMYARYERFVAIFYKLQVNHKSRRIVIGFATRHGWQGKYCMQRIKGKAYEATKPGPRNLKWVLKVCLILVHMLRLALEWDWDAKRLKVDWVRIFAGLDVRGRRSGAGNYGLRTAARFRPMQSLGWLRVWGLSSSRRRRRDSGGWGTYLSTDRAHSDHLKEIYAAT